MQKSDRIMAIVMLFFLALIGIGFSIGQYITKDYSDVLFCLIPGLILLSLAIFFLINLNNDNKKIWS